MIRTDGQTDHCRDPFYGVLIKNSSRLKISQPLFTKASIIILCFVRTGSDSNFIKNKSILFPKWHMDHALPP